MRKVLVTGGAGFIGSYLCQLLLARGDEVVAVDDLSTGDLRNLGEFRNHPRLEFMQGDLSDRQLVGEVLAGVNEVYHLAAAVGVALVVRCLEGHRQIPRVGLLARVPTADRGRPLLQRRRPRQTGAYGMVLPRFVEAARRGGPQIVHDDGQQTRCFAPVQEVVKAVIALMSTPLALGKIFNIGSDQPITIEALARE